MPQPANGNGESKIRKILFNEISLLTAVCAVILSGFIYLTNPQKQSETAVELLKAQVAAQKETIETITKTQQNDIKETKGEIAGLRTEVQSLTNSIVELRTIINERIPKR